MNEDQAQMIARALGGRAWQSGGGMWLVLIARTDGRIVAISDEAVCEYESEESLGATRPVCSIVLV